MHNVQKYLTLFACHQVESTVWLRMGCKVWSKTQRCRLQKVTSLDRLGTNVLSPTNKSNLGAGSGTPRSATKTPGTAGRGSSAGPRKRVTFGMEPESGTPGSMKTGSVFKKKRRLHQARCLAYHIMYCFVFFCSASKA